MYRSILEINDQNLFIQDQDGDVHSQPGFALITERGIETGEEARSKAQKAKLNQEIQDILQSDQLSNIINSSISKEEAQGKINAFIK